MAEHNVELRVYFKRRGKVGGRAYAHCSCGWRTEMMEFAARIGDTPHRVVHQTTWELGLMAGGHERGVMSDG